MDPEGFVADFHALEQLLLHIRHASGSDEELFEVISGFEALKGK